MANCENAIPALHIYNIMSIENVHLQAPNTKHQTTSIEPAEEPRRATYVEPQSVQTISIAQEAAISEKTLTKDASSLEICPSDSSSMFHRDDDDPTLLTKEREFLPNMKIKRFKAPNLVRLFASSRPQWRAMFYLTIGLILLLILYAAMNHDTSTSSRIADFVKGGGRISATLQEDKASQAQVRVKLEVYMESQCPDTAEFLDSQLAPVWSELKGHIDLSVIPFGKARWWKQGPDDYSFQCQHGANECLVNQLMCCGIEKLKTPELYLAYILCLQGTSFGDEDESNCDRQASLSHQDTQTCANSKHGRQLHQEMGNRTKSLTPPMFFVPWILIDGKRDSASLGDLKTSVCKKLIAKGVKPPGCEGKATAANEEGTAK